jgi:cytochrome b561
MLHARRRESVMDGMAALPPKGTDAAHPAGQYGAIAKLFHWVTLGLMLVALPLGFVIQHVKDASKMGFYALHESAGLTILFVAIARLIWRWLSPPPTQPSDMPKLMRTASTAVHHALYALLIIQPLLGFMATNAWGFPMQGATAYLGFIEIHGGLGRARENPIPVPHDRWLAFGGADRAAYWRRPVPPRRPARWNADADDLRREFQPGSPERPAII